MGMSFLQGGSGYPFFAPSVFQYLTGKDLQSITVSTTEIPNDEVEELLRKVWFS